MINWSRRAGKTRALCTLAVEECLRNPKSRVLYVAPTQDMARAIVMAEMRELLEGPGGPRLAYTFSVQALRWTFPNGSTIKLGGCDGLNANRLRGGTASLAIIDEAAFVSDLTYIVESILEPTLLTRSGHLVMSSTPPDSPEHPFKYYAIAAIAANDNSYDTCTLDEVEHISEAQREDAIVKAGGRGATTCKREYFTLFVTDEKRAVVPEFQVHKAHIVREVERPRHFDCYTVIDTGFNDLSVCGFGYYHFALAALVIEDELVLRHMSGAATGRLVLAKERELWGDRKPLVRWADASPQVIADMREGSQVLDADGRVLHSGCAFAMAEKQDSDAALNRLRNRVERHSVIIHPRCVTTIAHMEFAIWADEARTNFVRIKGDQGHHFDGVAMMKYAVRACRWGKNPAPIVEPHHPDHAFAAPHLLAQQKRVDQARRGQGDPFAAAFARRDR